MRTAYEVTYQYPFGVVCVQKLVVTDGVDDGKQFELVGLVVEIGRDSSSRVRLFDSEVSRHHARLIATNSGYRLEDLGSINGIFVNDQKVRRADLRKGDRIKIGNTTLELIGEISIEANDEPAEKVRLLTSANEDLSSVIVRQMKSAEGSRILATDNLEQSPWLRTRLANLNILYEAIQAISHILDVDQLLAKVLELLFRSVEADRGCILLRDAPDMPLRSRAVRWREGVGPKSEIAVSRTIIDYVLQNQDGVQIADAGQDERFASGQSILRYGIREAICVPLTGRHECVGALYFDTLLPYQDAKAEKTRFTPDHLTLAVAVGHQAALAVEETRYYQALVQSERMAAVGHAIAALSHHIKNMLQGLKSGGELLKLGIADNDPKAIQSGWRLFDKNQAKIYDLVLDMLSYSKEREPNLESSDLDRVITDVLELTRPLAADNGVALNYQPQNLIPMLVDPEAIHRALLNLVTNAIEATAGRPAATVDIHAQTTADSVIIEVRDNGIGISDDQMRDLFQPFWSSKGNRGTGLGLAVSRKIAQEHGGDINVTSQPDVGSSFVMTLPLRRPDSLPKTHSG